MNLRLLANGTLDKVCVAIACLLSRYRRREREVLCTAILSARF